ncbi:hypothetical protein JOF28_000489 [Leucobacter exalbidus]|uniref:Glycosyltransferase 2-like domain-containing protein n=1 Tax=Leucobacter exalbidus TaxID=662960 RepID=A0A940PRD0_9MICO|nr:glycosyltransferase [Leucobacter exalbidus]MBP1325257.1 hypothetical protein [Leucobacter exalbidus]
MSDQQPFLDIFIPHWGDTAYLRLAVESVLAQHDDRWRLTIVDDATSGAAGSETLAYFAELAALNDSRITTMVKPVNEGITANFRTCAQLATGGLVTIMGNDDRLLPGYVRTLLAAGAAHPEADIIQPAVHVIDDAGAPAASLVDSVKQRLLRPRSHAPVLLAGDQLGASLLRGDWLYWPSLCFARETLQRHDFRDGFAVIQDLALLMDMFFDGAALLVLPASDPDDFVFEYRRHDESASSVALTEGTRFAGERAYYALAASLAGERGWRRTVRAAHLRLTSRAHAATLVPGTLVRGRFQATGRLLRHALGN